MDDTAPPQLEMSTAVNANDHGIVITVVCWLCIVASLIFYGARLHIRRPLKSLFGHDDAAYTVATICTIIQTALMIFSVDRGFGTKQDRLGPARTEHVQKIVWTSDLFYVLSLCFSKLSVAWLLRRFSAAPERIRAFQAFIIAVGVYGLVGLLITALRQNVLHPWQYDASSAGTNLQRWVALGVMGIVLDIIGMLSPLYLIWDIQMNRRTKAMVVFAFAFRAPTIAFTALRLVALFRVTGNDFTWEYVTPEVYTQLEMHYSLIAATIPCLRIFLKAWNTSFLAMTLEDMDEQAFVQHTTAKGTYAMGSLSNSKDNSKVRRTRSPRRSLMRSNNGPGPWASKKSYGISEATVGGGEQDGDAASDHSQKAIVMKRTVDVDVG